MSNKMFNRTILRNSKREEKIMPSIESNSGQYLNEGAISTDVRNPSKGKSEFKIRSLLKCSPNNITNTKSYINRFLYSRTVEVNFSEFFFNHDRAIVVIEITGNIKKMNTQMIENIKMINPSTRNFLNDYFDLVEQDCLKNSMATISYSGIRLKFPPSTRRSVPDKSKKSLR